MTHNPADRSEMGTFKSPEGKTLKKDFREFSLAEMMEYYSDASIRPLPNWRNLLHQGSQAIQSLQDRVKALEGAIDMCMVGGNHAAMVIGSDHPPYDVTPATARSFYGAGDKYESWCCWQQIMLARDLRRTCAVKDGKTQNKESPGVGQGKEGNG